MSLISKICLGFVIWTVGGAVVYLISVAFHVLRGQMLDPYNKDLSEEYGRLAMDEGFRITGMPRKAGVRKRTRSDGDAKIDLEFFGAMAMAGVTWPLMLHLVHTGYTSAYRQLKDEYDRGIRTRKEKEASL